jgi:hypothetical protein
METHINEALGWHMGAASVLSAREGSNTISWTLNFGKPRDSLGWNQAPFGSAEGFTYQVRLKVDPSGQVSPEREVLRTSAPLEDHTEPLRYIDVSPGRSMVFDRRQRKLVAFDAGPSQGDGTQDLSESKANVSPTVIPTKDATLLLSKMQFNNEFPTPSACRSLLSGMAFYPGFDVGRYSKLRLNPSEVRRHTTLQPDGENLGTVIHEMWNTLEFKSQFEDLLDFMRAAYPFFEELKPETAHGAPGRVSVMIKERGIARKMGLWEISDGMLRFLCLAAALLNPLPPPFIGIDEPEAGLHPRLLPIVADMIKASSQKSQILVMTHSPDLLNRFSIEDVAVLNREEARARWFRPSSRQTLVKMLQTVTGESLGDLHRSGELEAVG